MSRIEEKNNGACKKQESVTYTQGERKKQQELIDIVSPDVGFTKISKQLLKKCSKNSGKPCLKDKESMMAMIQKTGTLNKDTEIIF